MKYCSKFLVGAGLSVALAACGGGSGGGGGDGTQAGNGSGAQGGDSADSGGTGGKSGTGGKPGTGGKQGTGGEPATGGTSSEGGSAGQSGGGEAGGGSGPDADAPVLTQVSWNVVGRRGTDWLFRVEGSDTNGDALGIEVELLDAESKPVKAFDTDLDPESKLDSATDVLLFNPLPLPSSFEGRVRLPSETQFAGVTQARVRIVDRADRRSAWKDVALTAQQLVGENEACDEDLIVSRCAPGLSCADDLCKVGVAPVIEKAAYINRGTWGHVIVAGTDPDDDELKLRESFYNLQDEPVKLYDFEGDPGYSSFEYAMAGDDRGTYLLELATSDTFLDAVKRLRLRVSDSLGANSDEVTADLGAPTQANEGATCDPRGFVECKSGLLCVPSTGDKFACKKGTEVRTAACKAAPVIGPGTTTTHWAGWATHDYWNTPGGFGCEETTNRKEAIVRFKLEQDATRVSISAIRPETKAITALYVLPGCPDTSAAALGCNQATQQPDEKDATLKAHLVLPTAPAVKVPKGEYTVVMEAVMNPRYSIGVEITVE